MLVKAATGYQWLMQGWNPLQMDRILSGSFILTNIHSHFPLWKDQEIELNELYTYLYIIRYSSI